MATQLIGLPADALNFLERERLKPGDKCWCCDGPLPDSPRSIGDTGVPGHSLRQFPLREDGCYAQEYVQATISKELGDDKVYLALKILKQGGAEVSTIKWNAEVITSRIF